MLDVIKMNTRSKGAHSGKLSCKADTFTFVKIRSQEFPCSTLSSFNLASMAFLRESVLVPAMRYFAVITANVKLINTCGSHRDFPDISFLSDTSQVCEVMIFDVPSY